MNQNEDIVNGVKGTGTQSEGVSPGRCSVDQQRTPGRHQAAANTQHETKWRKKDNIYYLNVIFAANQKFQDTGKGWFTFEENGIQEKSYRRSQNRGWLIKFDR